MGLTGLHGTHGDTWGLMGYPNGPLKGRAIGSPCRHPTYPCGHPIKALKALIGGPKGVQKGSFGVPTLDLRGSQDLRGSSKWEVLRSEDLQIHGFDLIFRGLDLF